MKAWVDKTLGSFREEESGKSGRAVYFNMKPDMDRTKQWYCTWRPSPVPSKALLMLQDQLSGLMTLASLRLIQLARLSHGSLGKCCFKMKNPSIMCFVWLRGNDPIQREICTVLAAAAMPTKLTKMRANQESLCGHMSMNGTHSATEGTLYFILCQCGLFNPVWRKFT